MSERNNLIGKGKLRIVLSVVALVELLLFTISATFAWFEGGTSLTLTGSNISTAPQLMSVVKVGEGLGETTTDGVTVSTPIDLTKYFEAGSNTKFTPVSSADGKNFYSLYEGVAGQDGQKWRKLPVETVHSSVLTFQFAVQSDDADCNFWFSTTAPIISVNGSTEDIGAFRVHFSDDNAADTHKSQTVSFDYSADNTSAVSSVNSDGTPNISSNACTDYSDIANSQTYVNSLFFCKKGETTVITCSIWLEALDSRCGNIPVGADVDFNITLWSSWSDSVKQTLMIVDSTNTYSTDTVFTITNTATNNTYSATYDSTVSAWTVRVPLAAKELSMTVSGDESAGSWSLNNRSSNKTYTINSATTGSWGQ